MLDTLTSGALQGAASVSASTSAGAEAALLLQQSSSAQAALEISGWIMADIIGQQTSDASHVSYCIVYCTVFCFDSNVFLYLLFLQASLQRWVTVLEAASPAEQSVGLRLSAANSLLHSQLFNSSNSVAGVESAELVLVHLRASVVALTLLQVSYCAVFSTVYFFKS